MRQEARRTKAGEWTTDSNRSTCDVFHSSVFVSLVFLLAMGSGCAHDHSAGATALTAPFQQYLDPRTDWSSIQRVVLMPLANQTAYPKIADEMQTNLAAELQRAGRFDIVVATREDPGAKARNLFASGRFDEVELLRVAREYQAQAVLFGQVTQYHPYNPPRVGLSLLMIHPAEGIAIASAEGLWDARETGTAAQAKQLYGQSLSWPQSVLGTERVLESPDVFQRFVSQQVASSLIPPSAPVALPVSTDTQNFVLPASNTTSPPSVPPAAPANRGENLQPPHLPNNPQP